MLGNLRIRTLVVKCFTGAAQSVSLCAERRGAHSSVRFLVAEIFSCFHTFVFFLTFVSDTAAVMMSLRTSPFADLD